MIKTPLRTIALRVDGSIEIGTGHYMRCLVIARALREKGFHSVFVSKEHDTLLGSIITDAGFALLTIPKTSPQQGAYTYQHWAGGNSFLDGTACGNLGYTTWFVDHYGLDASWTRGLKQKVPNARVIILDDMQDRALDGDVLLDPNLRTQEQIAHWKNLAPSMTHLVGPAYLPMPSVFAQEGYKRYHKETVERVLINYSGIDTLNATQKTLDVLTALNTDLSITILANPKTPYISEWENTLKNFAHTSIIYDLTPKDVSTLYLQSDIAFGAGGVASWERCVSQLPTLMAWVAENQKNQYMALKQRNAICPLGHPSEENFKESIEEGYIFLSQRSKRTHMSEQASKICDGTGLQRVLNAIIPSRRNDL